MNAEDIYWSLLSFESGLSIRKVNQVISHCYGLANLSLQDFFYLPPERMKEEFPFAPGEVEKLLQSCSYYQKYVAIMESLQDRNVRLVKSIDEEYPQHLEEVLGESAPPLLYCLGDTSMLNKKMVAIIGQREAFPASRKFARESACYLASRGMVIVSGFAKGIDQEAHMGAIEGRGQTIAILAEGILSAKAVLHKTSTYIDSGQVLLVSQFPPDSPWQTPSAMARNRVIVGLARAVLVGQVGLDGGTHMAASSAMNLGKPVFVFMHKELDPTACRKFVSKGAAPIQSTYNEEEDLAPVLEASQKESKWSYKRKTASNELQLELIPPSDR